MPHIFFFSCFVFWQIFLMREIVKCTQTTFFEPFPRKKLFFINFNFPFKTICLFSAFWQVFSSISIFDFSRQIKSLFIFGVLTRFFPCFQDLRKKMPKSANDFKRNIFWKLRITYYSLSVFELCTIFKDWKKYPNNFQFQYCLKFFNSFPLFWSRCTVSAVSRVPGWACMSLRWWRIQS